MVASSVQTSDEAMPPSNPELVVVLCGNRGKLETCGCSAEIGKISTAKEATFLKALRIQYENDKALVLIVDVGRNVPSKQGAESVSSVLSRMPVDFSSDLGKAVRTGQWEVSRDADGLVHFWSSKGAASVTIDIRRNVELKVLGQSVPWPNEHSVIVCMIKIGSGEVLSQTRLGVPANVPEDEEIFALLTEQAKKESDDLIRALVAISMKGTSDQSALSCGNCHMTEYRSWLKSRHAHALDTLIEKKRVTSECLPCHSTTYRAQSGFAVAPGDPEQAVTCVSCHTEASSHAKAPLQPFSERVAKAACLSCHDTETSPNFDFEVHRRKVHENIR